MTVPSSEEILAQVNRILASEPFRASDRLSGFLDYTVRKTLSSEQDQLKESLLAIELFGRRGSDFDSRGDTVVRVNATRLRDRLEDYYRNQGAADPVRIGFPRGSYVPVFERLITPPAAVVTVRRNPWLWVTAIAVSSAAAILVIFFWPQAK